MDLTPFTTTGPGARHDGWTPERKLRFLDKLSFTGNVRTACACAGMSREAAYRLRRRDALFARGWNAALVLARPNSADVLADKATEGIEEEVWYRGELVGTRRRFDSRLLLAHMARLDRMVEEVASEEDDTAQDAARFDELLAGIGGTRPPEHLAAGEEALPLDRESTVLAAEEEACDIVSEIWHERRAEGKGGRLTTDERRALECEIEEAAAGARAEAGQEWDAWFAGACEAVDKLLSGTAKERDFETLSETEPDLGEERETGENAGVTEEDVAGESDADRRMDENSGADVDDDPAKADNPQEPGDSGTEVHAPGTVSNMSTSRSGGMVLGYDGVLRACT